MFIGALYHRTSIQIQPVFKYLRIDAAEIQVESQVTFEELVIGQRRVFAILPTLDRVADYERHSTRTVVGTVAVVLDPSAEFGEG